MKVAAIYDIHGNLPALEAVLEEVTKLKVDQIVAGGDVVLGPMSRECLSLLSGISIPIQFIKGNCEVSVLNAKRRGPAELLPKNVLEDIRWTADQLLPDQEKQIATWPKTLELDVEGLGKVLFCHGTPRDENENFTKLTSEEKLLPIFENLNVDLVVCGHTHMQFDRMIGKVRVINAGSVGMPFGKPGAYWLLLSSAAELRYTHYNLDKAADLVMKTNYPHANEFTQGSLLNPPSEAVMLDTFAKAEQK